MKAHAGYHTGSWQADDSNKNLGGMIEPVDCIGAAVVGRELHSTLR